ncbi:Tripeptidyl peptidase II-domain-containing protein, partial [Blyttiomyces helicus]
ILRRFLRPTDSQIAPLKSRDVLPDSRRLHELVLTYSVKIADAGAGISVTPRSPRFNALIYDSIAEGFALIEEVAVLSGMDSVQLVARLERDVNPKSVKLSDGTYTIRVQVQSRSIEMLDRLAAMPLVLDSALSKTVTLPIHSTLGNAITGVTEGGAGFKSKTLARGDRTRFWIGGEPANGIPKDAKPGDLLLGKLELGAAPAVPVAWLVPPEVKTKEAEVIGEKEPVKDDSVLIKEAIRDLEISWLKKCKSVEHRATLLARLMIEHPGHLPLLKERLELLTEKAEKATKSTKSFEASLAREIVEAADAILAVIDERELAIYFGTRQDVANGGEKAKNKKKEMEKRKEALVAAYGWKGRAIKELIVAEETSSASASADAAPEEKPSDPPAAPTTSSSAASTSTLPALFDATLSTHAQWLSADPTSDPAYLLLWSWQQRRRTLPGTALKSLNKFLADPKATAAADPEVVKRLADEKNAVLDQLGWELWKKYDERWSDVRYPKEFALF